MREYFPLQRNCANHPWLIDPGPRQYLYVTVPGTLVSNTTKCSTSNRIIVHTGGTIHVAVCPKPDSNSRRHIVEIFSEGWSTTSKLMIRPPGDDPSRTVAVEFIINEPETYTVTWLELTRRFAYSLSILTDVSTKIIRIIFKFTKFRGWYRFYANKLYTQES